jgi:FKBP-type peptidyl-prolyl cis-trans isomerase
MNRFKIFLLLNLCSYAFGFTSLMRTSMLKMNNNIKKPITCNLNNGNLNNNFNNLNRRQLIKLPLKAANLALIPAFANYAQAEEVDISWTTHNGPFTEQDIKDFIKTDSGLLYKDIKEGSGNMPNDGDAVTIQMVGYVFETGDKWTNTYKGIPTYQSVIRAGPRENQKFMKGLNEGVKTMKRGGKRVLVIPAYLAYNYVTIYSEKNPGVTIIPGGSALVCYIEVVDFKPLK